MQIQLFYLYIFNILLFVFCKDIQAQNFSKLNIYTTHTFNKKLAFHINKFKEKTYCQINWCKFSNSTSLIMRLQLEAENSKADLIIGIDSLCIEEAQILLQHLKNKKKYFETSNKNFINERNQAYVFSPLSIVCKGEKIFLKNFQELLNKLDNKQLIFQDPRTSLPGLIFIAWINHNFKNPNNFWKYIYPKILTVTQGWSHSYGLFLQGQAKCIVSYASMNNYYFLKDNNCIYPLTFKSHPLQILITGILKSSKNYKKSKNFINFLLNTKIQLIIANENWMWPIKIISLPKKFINLKKFNTFLINPKEVMKQRKIWTRNWQKYLQ